MSKKKSSVLINYPDIENVRYRELQFALASRYEEIARELAAIKERNIEKLLTVYGARRSSLHAGLLVMSNGDIWSTHNSRLVLLRQGTKPGGYNFVGIGPKSNRKYFMVHRLVATEFVDNPHNHPQVNHIDGIKANNKWNNLEWVTAQENSRHAMSLGLVKSGIENQNSKLTAAQVRAIRRAIGTYKVIGANFGVSAQTVCNVKRRSKYADVP